MCYILRLTWSYLENPDSMNLNEVLKRIKENHHEKHHDDDPEILYSMFE